jgi:hypothetical protein
MDEKSKIETLDKVSNEEMPKDLGPIQPEALSGADEIRPPRISTKFRPGQSGNPKGRPKGSARAKRSIARVALERKVPINQDGASRRASVRRVAFERIGDKAVSGDIRSVSFLLAHESAEDCAATDHWPLTPSAALEILRVYFEQQTKESEKHE